MDRKNQKKAADAKPGESGKKGSNLTDSVLGGTDVKEEEDTKFVFTVVPARIQLNPKMGYKVQFRANSFNVDEAKEEW